MFAMTKQMIKQMTIQTDTNFRSEVVPPQLLSKLKKFTIDNNNKTYAAQALGITRNTLARILKDGTANSKTLAKIRAKIN